MHGNEGVRSGIRRTTTTQFEHLGERSEKAEAVPIRREAQINDRPIILGERLETWEADSPIEGRMAQSVALTRKEETGGHGHIGWQLSSSVASLN